MRGFPFIVIEGVDGVGKSSVAQLLAKRLRADYFSTPIANSRFAELRTHVDAGADPLTRYFYYLSCVAAAGVEVQQACRRNIVVCDRWVFSTIAYHCAMYEGLRTYSQNTSSLFLKPDYSVLLVASESVRTGRIVARRELSAQERLQFHQQQSGPVMEGLHGWLEAQLAEKKVEPNSGLGKAITYLLRHWKGLTTFLREAGAPLDNNICTAVSGSADVMPPPGLCRVLRPLAQPAWFLTVPDAA